LVGAHEGISRTKKSPTQIIRRAEFVVATTATGVKHSFNLWVSSRKASYKITVMGRRGMWAVLPTDEISLLKRKRSKNSMGARDGRSDTGAGVLFGS
jgi:hypothetical protein